MRPFLAHDTEHCLRHAQRGAGFFQKYADNRADDDDQADMPHHVAKTRVDGCHQVGEGHSHAQADQERGRHQRQKGMQFEPGGRHYNEEHGSRQNDDQQRALYHDECLLPHPGRNSVAVHKGFKLTRRRHLFREHMVHHLQDKDQNDGRVARFSPAGAREIEDKVRYDLE